MLFFVVVLSHWWHPHIIITIGSSSPYDHHHSIIGATPFSMEDGLRKNSLRRVCLRCPGLGCVTGGECAGCGGGVGNGVAGTVGAAVGGWIFLFCMAAAMAARRARMPCAISVLACPCVGMAIYGEQCIFTNHTPLHEDTCMMVRGCSVAASDTYAPKEEASGSCILLCVGRDLLVCAHTPPHTQHTTYQMYPSARSSVAYTRW